MKTRVILALLFIGLMFLSCAKSNPFVERHLATIPDKGKEMFSQTLLDITITFSPDGSKVAYIDGKRVFVNGEAQPEFEKVQNISFGPDGGKLAYAANQNGKSFMVLNGEKQGEFDEVKNAIFSPTGDRFAYAAKRGAKWFVVIDGKEQKEYDNVGNLAFNADGTKLACVVKEANTIVVMSNEQKIADLGTALFGGEKMNKIHLFFVLDEIKTVEVIDGTGRVTVGFNPNDSGGFSPMMSSGQFSTSYIRIDDKNTPAIGSITSLPAFSKDLKRVAYVSTKDSVSDMLNMNAKFFVVTDGQIGSEFDLVKEPTFSEDGSKIAYIAKQGDKAFVVIGDKKSPEYDAIYGPIVFAPEGDKIAFGVRQGKELSWKVMNLQ